MLVVRIELWPHGEETKAREIGRTYIANVKSNGKRADYKVAVCRRGTTTCPWPHGSDLENKKRPEPVRIGSVKNYPRTSYNVWRLVLRALRDCFPEERAPEDLNAEESEQLAKLLENPPDLPQWVIDALHGK